MPDFLFPPTPLATIPVRGQSVVLAPERLFCIGRNYADHAAEMGAEIVREKPFFFLKSPHAIMRDGGEIPFPPETKNYHYEMELAVVLGRGGFRIDAAAARDHVFGYACALDMTRRDLQLDARNMGRPWDSGKDVEHSAILGSVVPRDAAGPIDRADIGLIQNDTIRQDGRIDGMIWGIDELIALLSRYYHLRPGDVILTGTPAGVGPVAPGDQLIGRITGLPDLHVKLGAPE
ncbi:fumarylacetoacetase (plasmid) [Pacificitalea manganoxidans]|jgi:fumarylpyruvate hydrolase|uniref:Fumarylacetoacetase n=1 Tax=Pacificitalea manganoxidans TaxID=1411902 RepID=A0A291M3W8_9RHOB|nr:fumarylacetoacetate hydrolase family protein [Pacificitalea manganoxidans]ATI43671.1 fumarylacetoacetase [Pacificitalea manganoxidans]MDR6310065.1 fumarylpyruvate hydrolase [Pacificitalea manganoxidans]